MIKLLPFILCASLVCSGDSALSHPLQTPSGKITITPVKDELDGKVKYNVMLQAQGRQVAFSRTMVAQSDVLKDFLNLDEIEEETVCEGATFPLMKDMEKLQDGVTYLEQNWDKLESKNPIKVTDGELAVALKTMEAYEVRSLHEDKHLPYGRLVKILVERKDPKLYESLRSAGVNSLDRDGARRGLLLIPERRARTTLNYSLEEGLQVVMDFFMKMRKPVEAVTFLELQLQRDLKNLLERGISVEELRNLKKIVIEDNRLELSSCAIGSTVGLYKIQDFNLITILDLSNNQLKTLPVGCFDSLKALTILCLFGNKLTQLPVGCFDKLVALEELDLSHNPLKKLSLGCLNELTALTSLNLSSNKLKELPAGCFDKLVALEELNLCHNRLKELPAGCFEKLIELAELNLFWNGLPQKILKHRWGARMRTQIYYHGQNYYFQIQNDDSSEENDDSSEEEE